MSLPATLNTSDCFDDLISVRGHCSDQTPTSGYYIDDAGVGMAELNRYIGPEFTSGEALFLQKKNFAIAVIENQINTHLSAKYVSRTLIEGKRSGFYQDNQIIQGAPGGLAGIKFRLSNPTSYLRTLIAEVSLQLNYNGDVDLYLYDLIQGSIVQTFQITVLAKQISTIYPQIKIDSSRQLMNMALLYDTTSKPSIKSILNTTGCSSCSNYSVTTANLQVQGIQIGAADQKIDSSCVPLEHTAGMSVVYSLSCNHRGWLCSISNLLAIPLIYKTCELLMEYALYNTTERVNSLTIIPEKLEERRMLYRDNYDKAIRNVLSNISLPSDAKSFECSQPVRYATMLP